MFFIITIGAEEHYAFSNGNILYVGGSGANNYTSIQDAIDDAENGDIVFVYDDSSPYYECIIINKSIELKGENKYTTVIKYRNTTSINSLLF